MVKQNLRIKLANVMKDCHYIQKIGKNNFHGYNYVTSADVLDKVNTALLNNGIITTVTPTLIDFREVTTAKGNVDKHATISVMISMIDIESGESVQISGIGSGQDSGDKAIMKAETAAIKYAYMLSFCIATGDDPEADSKTDERVNDAIQATERLSSTRKTKPSQSNTPHCIDCGIPISAKVAQYSSTRYKEPLCMNCQKSHHQSA